jgi:hypothetical protein
MVAQVTTSILCAPVAVIDSADPFSVPSMSSTKKHPQKPIASKPGKGPSPTATVWLPHGPAIAPRATRMAK